MAAQWYWLVGEHEYGPFTGEQLRNLARGGQLTRDHSVRPETSANWLSATDIPGLFPEDGVVPPVETMSPRKAVPPPAPRPTAPVPPPPSATAKSAGSAPAAARKKTAAGKPVVVPPAPPVGPKATPAPRPVGTAGAAAPQLPPGPPVAPVGGTAGGHQARHGHTPAKPNPKQTYLVVGVLGLLVLLAAGGLALALRGTSKPTAPPTAAAAKKSAADEKSAKPEKPPTPEAVESDPQLQPAPAKKTVDVPGTKAAPAPPGTVAQASVKQWFEAPKKVILPGKFDMEILRARKGTSGKLPVLMVDVQVRNISKANELDFRGWSAASGDATAAELTDDAGKRLPGLDDAPPAPQALAPGDAVTQTLQFAQPKSEFKKLRLVLPGAALGRTTAIGFEIPVAIIGEAMPGRPDRGPVVSAGAKKPAAGQSPDDAGMDADLKGQIEDSKEEMKPPPATKPVEEPAPEKPKAKEVEEKPNLKLEIEEEPVPP